ncbi:MAG: tetratricopeptide repeat protein [Bacteroidales bacterium]|nr:tetratricopeptide repeat protein [Bacteroidales bacterium]MCF8405654.1 tetratricopeptide repeat protein [Bacteroidales bacterium]
MISENKYQEAFELLNESLTIFLLLDEEMWIARVSMKLSEEYKRKFEFDKALNLLFNASNVFLKQEKEAELSNSYNQIGGIFFDQDNIDKAFEYFQKALALYFKTGDNRGIGAAYNNIGEIYRTKHKFPEALDHYRKALAIVDEPGGEEFYSVVYNNIGSIFLSLERFDSALHYISLSKNLSLALKNPIRIASANISLGNYYLLTGDTTKSVEYFKSGYALSKQNSILKKIQEAALGLSKVFETTKNYEQAYHYHFEYKKASDSIVNINNYENITQMEMNRLYESEKKLNEIKRQKTNMNYFTLAILLIFIFVLLILLYGRQKIKIKHSKTEAENLQLENERLKDELEFKNRELTTKVMYMLRKNELINFIIEKLLNAKSLFSIENSKEVQNIIISLQKNVDQNIWEVFEKRFQDVHNNFYSKLIKAYPGLTKNDKKLCALIRLNLSTKEISALTHQNLNSIEVARTRLRKKLNISNREISLHRFLSNI